jgi:hypothetical protein
MTPRPVVGPEAAGQRSSCRNGNVGSVPPVVTNLIRTGVPRRLGCLLRSEALPGPRVIWVPPEVSAGLGGERRICGGAVKAPSAPADSLGVRLPRGARSTSSSLRLDPERPTRRYR